MTDSGPPAPETLDDDEGQFEDARMLAYEEELADRRASAIAAGKRKGGIAGGAMAGAMLALSEIYEGPKKDDKPVTVEAATDPLDLDKDGFGTAVGDVEVEAPPLERLDPVTRRRR